MTEPGVEYTLDFPKYLDGYEAETEAKGYLVDLKVSAGELTFTFSVYDPTRLAQGVAEETAADGYFALTLVRGPAAAGLGNAAKMLPGCVDPGYGRSTRSRRRPQGGAVQ
jgi:hypothetical protein